ncbi:hypothetical protein MMC2321_01224 [Chitinophaga sp. MM2321]
MDRGFFLYFFSPYYIDTFKYIDYIIWISARTA